MTQLNQFHRGERGRHFSSLWMRRIHYDYIRHVDGACIRGKMDMDAAADWRTDSTGMAYTEPLKDFDKELIMAGIPEARTVDESRTEQVQVVMPPHLNGYGKLFGGQLAVWIDILAGIVARRHCCNTITTAAIDNLRFRESVHQNEMVILKGRITHVGNTSMEVRVDSYVDDDGSHRLINTAFVIQVALDENGKPTKVPALIRNTLDEEREYQAGEKRRLMRQTIQKELYD